MWSLQFCNGLLEEDRSFFYETTRFPIVLGRAECVDCGFRSPRIHALLPSHRVSVETVKVRSMRSVIGRFVRWTSAVHISGVYWCAAREMKCWCVGCANELRMLCWSAHICLFWFESTYFSWYFALKECLAFLDYNLLQSTAKRIISKHFSSYGYQLLNIMGYGQPFSMITTIVWLSYSSLFWCLVLIFNFSATFQLVPCFLW